mmetsp:Transcript_19802/g.24425  ORF Transcript_19802/g.24425 Transcript_19802/m.24425 type:complete len:520 (+) Transcript_19802:97-1656(+)
MPPSQALNEIRRLRRDRYGTTVSKLLLKRRNIIPTSFSSSSDNNNVPRQRHINRTSTKHIKGGSAFSSNEGNESLARSLLDANFLEIRASLGDLHTNTRRPEFGRGQHLKPIEDTMYEDMYRGDYYGDDDDEECGCIPGKDDNSKRRREYWRNRLRDGYIIFFAFMFISAITVLITKEDTNDRETALKINSMTSPKEEQNITVMTNSTFTLLDHIQDLSTPYNKGNETPLFLDISLTGSSVVKKALSKCHNLVLACEFGLQQPNYSEDTLSIFSSTRQRFNATYINVDTSTSLGLQRAAKLNLVSSHIADVITVNSPYDSSIIFQTDSAARMFVVFSHPTARAIGYYEYIKRATWDERYNPDVKKMNLLQFASSNFVENNPIVRILTQAPGVDPFRKLTRNDLEVAKEIVGRKFLVGLYRDLDGSMARFDRYFGWSSDELRNGKHDDEAARAKKLIDIKSCRSELALSGDRWMSTQKSEIGDEGVVMDILEKSNLLDIKLYQHIELVFEAQGERIFNVV